MFVPYNNIHSGYAIYYISTLTTSYTQVAYLRDRDTSSSGTIYEMYMKKSSNGKTIYWYSTALAYDGSEDYEAYVSSAEQQYNIGSTSYNVLAIG